MVMTASRETFAQYHAAQEAAKARTADAVARSMQEIEANAARDAAIAAAAGPNIMAHRDVTITASGWAGAAQALRHLASADSSKRRSGDWLVSARRSRMHGWHKEACNALRMAASLRREAADRIKRDTTR